MGGHRWDTSIVLIASYVWFLCDISCVIHNSHSKITLGSFIFTVYFSLSLSLSLSLSPQCNTSRTIHRQNILVTPVWVSLICYIFSWLSPCCGAHTDNSHCHSAHNSYTWHWARGLLVWRERNKTRWPVSNSSLESEAFTFINPSGCPSTLLLSCSQETSNLHNPLAVN